jgi:hypothetical protein
MHHLFFQFTAPAPHNFHTQLQLALWYLTALLIHLQQHPAGRDECTRSTRWRKRILQIPGVILQPPIHKPREGRQNKHPEQKKHCRGWPMDRLQSPNFSLLIRDATLKPLREQLELLVVSVVGIFGMIEIVFQFFPRNRCRWYLLAFGDAVVSTRPRSAGLCSRSQSARAVNVAYLRVSQACVMELSSGTYGCGLPLQFAISRFLNDGI